MFSLKLKITTKMSSEKNKKNLWSTKFYKHLQDEIYFLNIYKKQ
jgi:hypothetical protein